MRMKLGTEILECLLDGAAGHDSIPEGSGSAVDLVAPLLLCIGVGHRIETGDQLTSEEGSVLQWQCEHLGDFISSNTHRWATYPDAATLAIQAL